MTAIDLGTKRKKPTELGGPPAQFNSTRRRIPLFMVGLFIATGFFMVLLDIRRFFFDKNKF